MALSDHDTTPQRPVLPMTIPVQDGVRLIPAAELTGYDFERSHRVHLLAFWPDLDCPALRRHCDIMRQRRNECALQSCPGDRGAVPPVPHRAGAGICAGQRRPLQERHHAGAAAAGPVRRHLHRACTTSLFGWEPRGKCLHSPDLPSGAGGAGHGQRPPGQWWCSPTRRCTRVCLWCGSWWLKGPSTASRWIIPATAPRTRPSAPPSARQHGLIRHRRQRLPRREPRQAHTLWGPASHPMTRLPASRIWPTRENSDNRSES